MNLLSIILLTYLYIHTYISGSLNLGTIIFFYMKLKSSTVFIIYIDIYRKCWTSLFAAQTPFDQTYKTVGQSVSHRDIGTGHQIPSLLSMLCCRTTTCDDIQGVIRRVYRECVWKIIGTSPESNQSKFAAWKPASVHNSSWNPITKIVITGPWNRNQYLNCKQICWD